MYSENTSKNTAKENKKIYKCNNTRETSLYDCIRIKYTVLLKQYSIVIIVCDDYLLTGTEGAGERYTPYTPVLKRLPCATNTRDDGSYYNDGLRVVVDATMDAVEEEDDDNATLLPCATTTNR